MNLSFKNYKQPQYLQEGGPIEDPNAAAVEQVPTEQAPAEQGGDPMQQVLEAAAQALQSQDCQMAMAVCQALLQMTQGAQEPAEPQGQPVYKMGGKLSRIIKK